MLSRLGRKMRSLLQKEINLEMRVSVCRKEREPLDIKDGELIAQFRATSSELEDAGRACRQNRLKAAQGHVALHMVNRLQPKFFIHPVNRQKIVPQVKSDDLSLRRMLKVAEEAQHRNFAPLGIEKNFPSAIDWFSDFQEGSWIFGADSDLRDVLRRPNEKSDSEMGPVEATWEFNRHSHFVAMGRAYWLTGLETLVSEFVVQAVDWAERNPALYGINWIDTTSIAARVVNWTLALKLFLSSEQLQPEVTCRLLKTLLLHGAILADVIRDPEPHLSPSELTAAASALNILSLTFRELSPAKRWCELSSEELPKRAWECVGRDGFHLSGSAARHRELLEWLLLPKILHRLNGLAPPKGLREVTETACESLTMLTPPDRVACDFGPTGAHSFLGQFVGATEHSRRLLALAAVACQRDDFRPGVEMPNELWWWLGPQAQAMYQGIDIAMSGGPKSRAFAQAGVVVSRDHWEREANWCLLRGSPKSSLLETAPPAPASIPLHDDSLHLSLCLNGESVFIEPGGPDHTHLVQPAFARISAHTAPRVGREREPLCLDRVSSRVESNLFEAKLGGTARYLSAHRSVWLTPERPWKLWREILFMPETKHMAVRDTLEGDSAVDFEASYLLSPHLDVIMRGDMGCLIRGKRLQARLVPIFPSRFRYSLKRAETKPVAGWCYRNGRAVPTYCLRYYSHLEAPFSTYLWVAWEPNDTRVPRTEELDRQYAQARERLGLED